MSTSSTAHIGVIADDFTGAIDAGVEFVRAGFTTSLILTPNSGEQAQVEVMTTNSRDSDALIARERTFAVAVNMQGRQLFKKIDSTMRGHVGEEITTILDVLGQGKAVVCPAAIEAGRIVRNGQLWVRGIPLHHSDFARDPRWPASTAKLDALVGAPTTHLSLATVHSGSDTLADAIVRAPTAIVTVDACDHNDLELISEAIAQSDSLPCGALGLARAWARCQSRQTHHLSSPPAGSESRLTLIVAGSRHPSTRAQAQQLHAQANVSLIEAFPTMNTQLKKQATDQACAAFSAGRMVLITTPVEDLPEPSAQRAVVDILGELTLRVCQAAKVGGMILTGGETANAVCHQLGATAISILGEVEVGIPWGRIVGGFASGCVVVTKAGGFGSEQALVKATEMLHHFS